MDQQPAISQLVACHHSHFPAGVDTHTVPSADVGRHHFVYPLQRNCNGLAAGVQPQSTGPGPRRRMVSFPVLWQLVGIEPLWFDQPHPC